jgi:hypothetical protein
MSTPTTPANTIHTGSTVFGPVFYFQGRVRAHQGRLAVRREGFAATVRPAPNFGHDVWAVEVR